MSQVPAPDIYGVLSGQVPIRVEASVSPQSMMLLAIVVISHRTTFPSRSQLT